ncbi:MAG: A/G-specific adenine glycosylase [Polyangiaceae bacterium]
MVDSSSRAQRRPKARRRSQDGSAGAEPQGHDRRKAQALHRALATWFDRAKRDLPWRKTRDPYAIWLSEVMLQQTRVDTVIPYYERFLAAFPTVDDLAKAPLDDVLVMWAGLGYYRRARLLHGTANDVADRHGGKFPRDAASLRELRGVGPYTAGAVASIAFDEREALVDGNVARVLARLFAIEDDVKSNPGLARIWDLARALVPEGDVPPSVWNQALMELGATVCTPRDPSCTTCPVRRACAAYDLGLVQLLPKVGTKAKPRPVTMTAFVVRRADAVLLAKRGDEGTFAGMWEPPAVEADADDGVPRLARALGLDVRSRGRTEPVDAGTVAHVLSHRKLSVRVFRIDTTSSRLPALASDLHGRYVELAWSGDDDRSRALTRFARKVLAQADADADVPARRNST